MAVEMYAIGALEEESAPPTPRGRRPPSSGILTNARGAAAHKTRHDKIGCGRRPLGRSGGALRSKSSKPRRGVARHAYTHIHTHARTHTHTGHPNSYLRLVFMKSHGSQAGEAYSEGAGYGRARKRPHGDSFNSGVDSLSDTPWLLVHRYSSPMRPTPKDPST